jgi:hypothetical protein
MIISVQDNLDDLYDKLGSMGYRVYRLGENQISDAYIYSEQNYGLSNLYSVAPPMENGSLLIDADNKTIEDIIYMINHRIYSPLF